MLMGFRVKRKRCVIVGCWPLPATSTCTSRCPASTHRSCYVKGNLLAFSQHVHATLLNVLRPFPKNIMFCYFNHGKKIHRGLRIHNCNFVAVKCWIIKIRRERSVEFHPNVVRQKYIYIVVEFLCPCLLVDLF